jgi:hypothetical protein
VASALNAEGLSANFMLRVNEVGWQKQNGPADYFRQGRLFVDLRLRSQFNYRQL